MVEKKISTALAAHTVKNFIQAVFSVRVTQMTTAKNLSDPTLLLALPMGTDVSQVTEAAIQAYPDKSQQISELALAVKDAEALAMEYRETPWRDALDPLENAMAPNSWTDIEKQMSERTLSTVTRVFAALDACQGYDDETAAP